MGNEGVEARVRITIAGHVQGVFFRKSTMDTARALGLSGWVRNLKDGRVEAMAEGDKSKLVELVEFCHDGPPGARVRDVVVEWSPPSGEFRGFRIIH